VSFRIPFNRTALLGNELEYVRLALESGQVAGDQAYTKRCERLLEEALGVPRVLLTTTCTHALEMAGLLLEIGSGDEVIVPSFTFVSTANAYVLRGAKPAFVDIREDTLNLDESALAEAITSRTKAIVPVHYGGVSCEMESILAVAAARGVDVIEDNAQGLFGRYRGRWLGTMGRLGAQSFHETKNFTCGEGGALVINDPALVDRAEIIREKGTDRAKFFRGQVDKYGWVDVGSSYVMSDLLAAFLLAQFEIREEIQESRRAIWEGYHAGLESWCEANGVRRPAIPEDCDPTYHLYYLLMPDERRRDGLITHLRERGILAVFHYLPLHLSRVGRGLGGRPGDCPVTESVAGRLIRLPFFTSMSRRDLEEVVTQVCSFSV
jgi:dTDP-4-amino-4,6-dideoxygalactose transaminase